MLDQDKMLKKMVTDLLFSNDALYNTNQNMKIAERTRGA